MHETRFIVVRHGETAWNAEGRIQGHLDSPLNEEGLAQALLVGERLAHERIEALYASDLGRVRQTVQPLLDRTAIALRLTERLRERNLGVFQGLTSRECQARFPEDYARFHGREVDHAVPGGESIRAINGRVATLFTDLVREHPGQLVVAVTHGGVLDALYRFVTGMPLERLRDFPIYNASLNWVRFSAGKWALDRWGDISHLTRDAALDDF